ncbi:hypothetical protein Pelo_18887 [Pelomyxa schiedti]|nr:hypothetical protein Pelo_18887 [Pelomyxa schiedti]
MLMMYFKHQFIDHIDVQSTQALQLTNTLQNTKSFSRSPVHFTVQPSLLFTSFLVRKTGSGCTKEISCCCYQITRPCFLVATGLLCSIFTYSVLEAKTNRTPLYNSAFCVCPISCAAPTSQSSVPDARDPQVRCTSWLSVDPLLLPDPTAATAPEPTKETERVTEVVLTDSAALAGEERLLKAFRKVADLWMQIHLDLPHKIKRSKFFSWSPGHCGLLVLFASH